MSDLGSIQEKSAMKTAVEGTRLIGDSHFDMPPGYKPPDLKVNTKEMPISLWTSGVMESKTSGMQDPSPTTKKAVAGQRPGSPTQADSEQATSDKRKCACWHRIPREYQIMIGCIVAISVVLAVVMIIVLAARPGDRHPTTVPAPIPPTTVLHSTSMSTFESDTEKPASFPKKKRSRLPGSSRKSRSTTSIESTTTASTSATLDTTTDTDTNPTTTDTTSDSMTSDTTSDLMTSAGQMMT